MAEGQILEAVNSIKNSMTTMQAQLNSVPTKTELNALVTEMPDVKEMVIRNTDRIDTLFDLRKEDKEVLANWVEKMVEVKLQNCL